MKPLPIIALPSGLVNASTGIWLWDAMPLLTMIPCTPTLYLYYRTRRWADLVSALVARVLTATLTAGAASFNTGFWLNAGAFQPRVRTGCHLSCLSHA